MSFASEQQMIEMLRAGMVKALGCTEPVACALACAKCREELGGEPERVEAYVSGNIFKNGMGVGIPGTGMVGLSIAAALGAICGKVEYGLEVLKDVSVGDNLARAKAMVDNKQILVKMKEDACDKLYAEAVCYRGNDVVKCIIVHAHTNIAYVEKNGEVVFEKPMTAAVDDKGDVLELNLRSIYDFVESVNVEDIAFLLEGTEVNNEISKAGLAKEFGLQIGRTLKANIDKGVLKNDLLTQALMRACAASDARMDGCEKAVMTNSGSGNQGITVYLPVAVAAEFFDCSREKLIRALALSNLVAAHIHHFMGHLSALCGITIASTGAGSAITYLMGGNYDNIVNTIKIMASNLTGMMCDGAKQGCALKVYSGVSSAIQASLLTMNGVIVRNDGIVEEDIERTVRNIGKIGTEGMEQTDKTILKIMCNK